MKLAILIVALCAAALILLVAADAHSTERTEEAEAYEVEDAFSAEEATLKRVKKTKKGGPKKKKGSKGKKGHKKAPGKKGSKGSGKKATGVCRKGTCCGTNNVAIWEDCPIATQRYCGSRNKCCPKVLYGVDSNDPNLWTHYNALAAAQVNFVVRYVSHQLTTQFDTPPISVTESRFWRQRGMPLVAVWETDRTRPINASSDKGNFRNGVKDAKQAKALMAKIGGSKAPVYFAVDSFVDPKNFKHLRKDIKIASVNAVIPYFQGVISVMGPKRTGAYGSYTLVKGLFDKKLIKYGWQASSFDSNGRLEPRAQLYQCSVYPQNTFGSSQVDYDFAFAKDFGQWH